MAIGAGTRVDLQGSCRIFFQSILVGPTSKPLVPVNLKDPQIVGVRRYDRLN